MLKCVFNNICYYSILVIDRNYKKYWAKMILNPKIVKYECDIQYYRNHLKFNTYISREGTQYAQNLKDLMQKRTNSLFYRIDMKLQKVFNIQFHQPFVSNTIISFTILLSFIIKSLMVLSHMEKQQLFIYLSGVVFVSEVMIARIFPEKPLQFKLQAIFILINVGLIVLLTTKNIITLRAMTFVISAQVLMIISFIILFHQHHITQLKKTLTKYSLPAMLHHLTSGKCIVLWITFISSEVVFHDLNVKTPRHVDTHFLINSICALIIVTIKLLDILQLNPYLFIAVIKKQVREDLDNMEVIDLKFRTAPHLATHITRVPNIQNLESRQKNSPSNLQVKSKNQKENPIQNNETQYEIFPRKLKTLRIPSTQKRQCSIRKIFQISIISIFFFFEGLCFYYYFTDNSHKLLFSMLPSLKFSLIVIFIQGIQVQIGQCMNYNKYPIIMFLFDFYTNIPSILLMIGTDVIQNIDGDVISLVLNGSLFIIIPVVVSNAFVEGYRQYTIFYQYSIMVFLILPQCFLQIFFLFDPSIRDKIRWILPSIILLYLIAIFFVLNRKNFKKLSIQITQILSVKNRKISLLQKLACLQNKFYPFCRFYYCITSVLILSLYHVLPNNLSGFKVHYFIIYAFMIYLYFLFSKLEVDVTTQMENLDQPKNQNTADGNNNQRQSKTNEQNGMKTSKNTGHQSQNNNSTNSTFKISVLPLFVTIVSFGFFLTSLFYQPFVQKRSLTLFFLILSSFFYLIIQSTNFIVNRSRHYINFKKLFIVNFVYLIIIFPFVIIFGIGYLASSADFRFISRYCIGGFVYISIFAASLGIVIHYILNLNAIGKKDLFITQCMGKKLAQLNIKDNPDLIIAVARRYQILNQNLQKLQEQLIDQKIVKVIAHGEGQDMQYAYSLQRPLDNNDKIKRVPHKQQYYHKKDINIKKNQQQSQLQNFEYIIVQKTQKQNKNKVKISESPKSQSNKYKQNINTSHLIKNQIKISNKQAVPRITVYENTNLTSFKNIYSVIKKQYSLSVTERKYRNKLMMLKHSDQYKKVMYDFNNEFVAQLLCKFYSYLSQPSRFISVNMFKVLYRMLKIVYKKEEINEQNQIQSQKYSLFLIDNEFTCTSFRNFILYFSKSFNLEPIDSSCSSHFQCFVLNFLLPITVFGQQNFRYSLFRKNIQFTNQQLSIWHNFDFTKKEENLINGVLFYWKRNEQSRILAETLEENFQLSTNKKIQEQKKQKQDIAKKKKTIIFQKEVNTQNKNIENPKQYAVTTNFPNTQTKPQPQPIKTPIVSFRPPSPQIRSNPPRRSTLASLATPFHNPQPQMRAPKHQPQFLYQTIANSIAQCFKLYRSDSEHNFEVDNIRISLSNLIAVCTKVLDFGYLYIYPCVIDLISYYKKQFYERSNIMEFVNFKVLIFGALCLSMLYIVLIVYHFKDFESDTLGVDDMQRTLSFSNIKYYTTFLLFILGSSLSSNILNISLNSYLCSNQTKTLILFQTEPCYTQLHFVYMFIGILILVSYYPLSLLAFPFSSYIDRGLQIKYRSQYEVIYIESKLLLIGLNVIFNSFQVQEQAYYMSICRIILCGIMFLIFIRLRPCSFFFFNLIEDKIIMLIIVINIGIFINRYAQFWISIVVMCVIFGIFLIAVVIRKFWGEKKIHIIENRSQQNVLENDENILVKERRQGDFIARKTVKMEVD